MRDCSLAACWLLLKLEASRLLLQFSATGWGKFISQAYRCTSLVLKLHRWWSVSTFGEEKNHHYYYKFYARDFEWEIGGLRVGQRVCLPNWAHAYWLTRKWLPKGTHTLLVFSLAAQGGYSKKRQPQKRCWAAGTLVRMAICSLLQSNPFHIGLA